MIRYLLILIILVFSVSGCLGGRLYGNEGALCYGIPFGRSSSEMAYRRHIPIKFGLVTPGMTKEDVLTKLGEPSHKSISDIKSSSGDNYHIWYYNSLYSKEHSMFIDKVYVYFDDYTVIDPS